MPRSSMSAGPDSVRPWGLRLFEPQRSALALGALLAVHVLAFALFYPSSITVSDESSYLRLSQLLLDGTRTISMTDPLTGEPIEYMSSDAYPLGTALFLAPFVAFGGWQAAFWAPLLGLVLGVAVTARWLYEQRRSPLWAALILVYPPTWVLARLTMSEMPSLLIVALGLWLFWRGGAEKPLAWFAAGAVAGVSFAFREANVLIFAPLFFGALVRRERGWHWLLVGGLAGLSLRFVSAWLFYDDPFKVKSGASFGLDGALGNLAIHLFALLVLVPGGLATAFAYRGPRRPELLSGVLLVFGLHVFYGYVGAESAGLKGMLLSARFFIPLLPLLSLCAAEVWPRWAARLRDSATEAWRTRGERALAAIVVLALAAAATGDIAAQRTHRVWSDGQARFRDAIYQRTGQGSVLVTNWKATGKFIDLVYGKRMPLKRERLEKADSGALNAWVRQLGAVYLVLLDRDESEFWRRDAAANTAFIARIHPPPPLEFELESAEGDRLRIWRMTPRSKFR